MPDVVCIGAATEDIFFFSDRFKIAKQQLLLPWGEKLTVGGLERRLGGGAFNASVAFSRLGLESALFGRVGNDRAGRSIKDFLEKEGVSTKFLVVDSGFKTSTSVLLSSSGERTIIMYRGTNDDLLETSPDWDQILNCRWVFLTDLAGTSDDLPFEVVRRVKKEKVRLAYVPGQREIALGKEALKPVLEAVDILVLNSYEAEMILNGNPTGKTPHSLTRRVKDPKTRRVSPVGLRKRQIKEMLVEFKKLGVGVSVITSGPKGSDAYDGERFYHQEVTPKVGVVDRTGAGDAFSSTFTAGIILGKSVPESLLLAARNSSSVVTKIGGTDGLLMLSQLTQ